MDRYKKILRLFSQNHHAEFDYGVIGINPESGRIFHKNKSDKWHNKEPAYSLNYLLEEFVVYHYEIILKEKKSYIHPPLTHLHLF